MIKVLATGILSSSILFGGFGMSDEKLQENKKNIEKIEIILEEKNIDTKILDQMKEEVTAVKTLFSIDEIKDMKLEEIEMLHEEVRSIKKRYYTEYSEYFDQINEVFESDEKYSSIMNYSLEY
jgi:galactitol-specific phosphotransferase system IIB component